MRKLSRRSFLRGAAGSLLALPWMESLALASAKTAPAQRMAFFYVPIGVVRKGFFPGEQKAVVPTGNNFPVQDISWVSNKIGWQPIQWTQTLEPLKPVQHKVNLITGMDRTFQIGTDVHAQCASCFLSSAEPWSITQSAWPLDRTLDQMVGDHVGQTTPFRTLELSCNSHKNNQESIYFDNISWYGTGHVAPSIRDPRKAYRRLFATQEIQRFRNITDLVLEDARSLNLELGYNDRQKFGEYFESIRTIEKQMDRLEKMKGELKKVTLEEPPDAYLPRGEYIRLMGDLMIVALQTGLTHVATLMVGPERWDTPLMFEGLWDKPMSHHEMSHNQQIYVTDLMRLDHFHMQQFVYLLKKMDSIQESDGSSLLDNSIFTYGSGLGDGSTHQYTDLPIVVAGSGQGKFKTGQHLHCPDGTPLANLWLTQAQAMGLNLEKFADSTGHLKPLLV